jgi:hypothetical protein
MRNSRRASKHWRKKYYGQFAAVRIKLQSYVGDEKSLLIDARVLEIEAS